MIPSLIPSFASRSCQQRPYSTSCRWWFAPVAAALVVALAVLSACAVGGSTTTNTAKSSASSPTSTMTPSATAKPKPTALPTTSVAYCQGLLSLADVNSVMKPAAPATSIQFVNDTSNHLSACSWSPGPTIAVLAVFFIQSTPGVSLNSIAQQQLAKAHSPAGGNIETTPVSGVGDQAMYLSATIPTPSGPNYAGDLVVAYGALVIGCAQTGSGTLPTGLEPELQEACLAVISQL